MRWRSLATGALAALAIVAWTGPASAGTNTRSKEKEDTSLIELGLNDDLSDLTLVSYRGGGRGGRGGHAGRGGRGGRGVARSRGFRGGVRARRSFRGRSFGFRRGSRGFRGRSFAFRRGFRGRSLAFRRGWGYGRRWYRPYWRGYRYWSSPYYYDYPYDQYYYSYPRYYRPYYYNQPYCPINQEVDESPLAYLGTARSKPRVLKSGPRLEYEESPQAGDDDEEDSYPYDGGPNDPVPQLNNRRRLEPPPKKPVPIKTRFISSSPKKRVKTAYRPYGE